MGLEPAEYVFEAHLSMFRIPFAARLMFLPGVTDELVGDAEILEENHSQG